MQNTECKSNLKSHFATSPPSKVPSVFHSLGLATVILAAFAITAPIVIAQDKTPVANIRDAIPGLVEQLSAATLAERTQAAERLVALGPDALPFLPAPDLLPSVAARQAIRSVRVRLEHEAA